METIGLVGDVSIPVMLPILGIQLAETDMAAVSRSATPSALKRMVAKVFVLECATPAAVIPLALTIEYADDVTVEGIRSIISDTSNSRELVRGSLRSLLHGSVSARPVSGPLLSDVNRSDASLVAELFRRTS